MAPQIRNIGYATILTKRGLINFAGLTGPPPEPSGLYAFSKYIVMRAEVERDAEWLRQIGIKP